MMKTTKPSPYKMKRVRLGLNQFELWKLTGVSPSRISLFENGLIKLKPEQEAKLREALGMKVKSECAA